MDTEGNSPEQRDRITHVGSYAGLTLFYTYTAAPHCPGLGTKKRGKTSPHRILCWYFPFSISRSIRRNRSIHHRPEPLLCPSSSTDFGSFWHRRNLPSVSGAIRQTTSYNLLADRSCSYLASCWILQTLHVLSFWRTGGNLGLLLLLPGSNIRCLFRQDPTWELGSMGRPSIY